MEREKSYIPNLFLDVPFLQRWECHKNIISRMYINEKQTLEEVAEAMKNIYQFEASVRQYKYRLKKWGIFKSVPSAVRERAIQTLRKRVRDGNAFEGIRYRGGEIDAKRLRRYINQSTQRTVDVKLASPVFCLWNLPYQALCGGSDRTMMVATPGGSESSTPSDYSVISPRPTEDPSSTTNASSPANALAPITRAIQARTRHERSILFIQGRVDEFLKDMSPTDKEIAVTWLHDYWTFAFVTSKYWGKGPKEWTIEASNTAGITVPGLLPGSPSVTRASEALSPLGAADDRYGSRATGHGHKIPQPSPWCRWCIHVHERKYEDIDSPPPEEGANYDAQNPDSWPGWAAQPCTIVERLHIALQDNSFSGINAQKLPVSAASITKATAASPDEMTAEAISFAIMARNADLVWDILDNFKFDKQPDLSTIYPFHLAASYLDGGSICCDIFDHLVRNLFEQNIIRKLYVNNLGHTVLDSLMLTILKGHTSCTPIMVDPNLRTMKRFPGEEVDICGRWDADSPCLRILHANDSPNIPFSWKHMFCHTSVQAICHSINLLFSFIHSPDIDTPSGLFTKTCFVCGTRLAPGPLHTLVLTAFYLAQCGCQEENLFGIVACLVCLLIQGADPTYQADLSASELLGIGEQEDCTHVLLDPAELGWQVPSAVLDSWSEEAKLGWDCMMEILLFAQRERIRNSEENEGAEDEEDDDGVACCGECDRLFYKKSRRLGPLWCAIRAELVSYRRLKDGDPWLSNNISLKVIRDEASDNGNFSRLALIDKGMLKPICRCGKFKSGPEKIGVVTTDEVCSFYFSNMENWRRSSYREVHDESWDWELLKWGI